MVCRAVARPVPLRRESAVRSRFRSPMSRFVLTLGLAAGLAASVAAQHRSTSDSTDHRDHAMHGMDHAGTEAGAMAPMPTSALDPSAPMTVDGSGSSWLPAASPMEALHASARDWRFMLHGTVVPRLTSTDVFDAGGRGAEGTVDAPNWVMGMAQRSLGDRLSLTLRAMLSADPLTEGGDGYPLLFQSGETYQGVRLVDRQHPHDVVSEASVTLAARLADGIGVFGAVGYPGEPALGPTAFMHRPSARFGADAPLSHHWQDATHIAWGVATAGIIAGPVKLDGSVFTGAEPDEDRLAPDRARFDSYAGRISWSPSARWVLQVSRAFLREPEAIEPGVDVTRTTASVLYAAPLAEGDLTATLAWGANEHLDDEHGAEPHDEHGAELHDEHGGLQHAFLAEGALRLGPWAVFTRGEVTQKEGAELALVGDLAEEVHTIGSVALGGARRVATIGGLEAMLGVQATAHAVPEGLRPVYGDAPVSAQAFLRISPSAMRHGVR